MDLQERLLKLIDRLTVPEPVRSDLKKHLADSGITQELMQHIGRIISRAITEHNEKMEREMAQAEQDLDHLAEELEQEFARLKIDLEEAQARAKQEDAQKLADIRKELGT